MPLHSAPLGGAGALRVASGKEGRDSGAGRDPEVGAHFRPRRREGGRSGPAHKLLRQSLRSLLAGIMLQFLLGFTLGNVVGMFLAQNYDMPNLAKKIEDIKRELEDKKKPPRS